VLLYLYYSIKRVALASISAPARAPRLSRSRPTIHSPVRPQHPPRPRRVILMSRPAIHASTRHPRQSPSIPPLPRPTPSPKPWGSSPPPQRDTHGPWWRRSLPPRRRGHTRRTPVLLVAMTNLGRCGDSGGRDGRRSHDSPEVNRGRERHS
jgi:hypothetical protein